MATRTVTGDICPDCSLSPVETRGTGVRCPTCFWFWTATPRRPVDFRTPGQRVLGPIASAIALVLLVAVGAVAVTIGLPLVVGLLAVLAVLGAGFAALRWMTT